MGKNTKIICTVVPNAARSDSEGRPCFSVFLTPRLPDSGILKDYYEMLHWFRFSAMFTDNLHLKVRLAKLDLLATGGGKAYSFSEQSQGGSPIGYAVVRDMARCREDYRQQYKDGPYSDMAYYARGRKLWEKTFGEGTPVKGWIFDEGERKRASDRVVQVFSRDEFIAPPESKVVDGDGIGGKLVDGTKAEMKGSLRLDDIRAERMGEEEIRFRNKENQEFHKKISILADYPHLLRMTGWIFDFQLQEVPAGLDYNLIKLDLSGLSDFIRGRPERSLWMDFSNEIDFKTPWSYVNRDPFSIRYLESLKDDYFEIENGFMKVSGNAYQLEATQFDHNQLLAKMAMAGAQGAEVKDLQSAMTGREVDRNSTGIGIKVVKRKKRSPLEKGIDAGPDALNSAITIDGKHNDSANIDDYIIFGHHLDTGYRVDVSMLDKHGKYTPFRSLCRRVADYKIDRSPYSDKEDFIDLLKGFEDEPWIAESAQAGKSGMLYVDEELCRWNNWSLTCPHIGNYPQDETEVEDPGEFNDLELQRVAPVAGSLLPLRFNTGYKFRIRVVDICGNSPSTESFDGFAASARSKIKGAEADYELLLDGDVQSRYKRLEPANAPELHYAQQMFKGSLRNSKREFTERVLKPEFYGEDLKTLVVRTRIANDRMLAPVSSLRSVSPPRAVQSFVELHGTVDELMVKGEGRKQLYERAAYVPAEGNVEVFRPGTLVPFLTDPVVYNFEVRIARGPGGKALKGSLGAMDVWKESGAGYLDRRFIGLLARGVGIGSPGVEAVTPLTDKLEVSLLPGALYQGEFESVLVPVNAPFHSGVTVSDDAGKALVGKKTSPKQLLFVHAVQKPVLVNKDGIAEFRPSYRLLGKLRKRTPTDPITVSFTSLSYMSAGFPLSSSGEIRIIGEYDEVVFDADAPQGFRVEAGRSVVKSLSNLAEGLALKVEDNFDEEKLLGFSEFRGLAHSFGDARYRKVSYKVELVSRFREYFQKEREFSVFGEFREAFRVDNAKKLDALRVESIVPVFSWEVNDREAIRYHDKFRLYLMGDWYQHGASVVADGRGGYVLEEMEKVAVLFINRDSAGVTDKGSIPEGYEGLVSEFGSDPTTRGGARAMGLYNGFFDQATFVEGVDPMLLERGESSFAAPVQNPATALEVRAAIYQVNYDASAKRFYCDIQLKRNLEQQLYFPFVKLAVCRYLAPSISEAGLYDYRFSNVAMAPQCQLFPTRRIDLKDFSIRHENGRGSNIVGNLEAKHLEIYLVMERKGEAQFSKMVEKGLEQDTVRAIRLSAPGNFRKLSDTDIKQEIRNFGPSRMYIEEYEVYSVWHTDRTTDFQMVGEGSPDSYNPRNDIRRRLVFTYQIR